MVPSLLADKGCELCIDGRMPAGEAIHIGLIYVACPNCVPDCPACGGDSMFPAGNDCLACFLKAMFAHHLDVIVCVVCGGIITAYPTDDPETPPDSGTTP